MRDVASAGKVYIADFHKTIKELAEFGTRGMQPIAAYLHAMVKGVKLTGRGEKYAEDSVNLDRDSGTNREGLYRQFEVVNPENILSTNWHPKFQINSWCSVTDHYVAAGIVKMRAYFGQINYMFRMFVPSDKILNGCAFANVVLRKPTVDPHRGQSYVGMRDEETYVGDKHFVSLNYLNATAVALSALDVNDMPIMNPSQVRKNMKFKPKNYKLLFSEKRPDQVERLYCIDLHKERLDIEYDTIEDDNHSTKVFEKKVLEHHTDCAMYL
jgi:hypothetical protein